MPLTNAQRETIRMHNHADALARAAQTYHERAVVAKLRSYLAKDEPLAALQEAAKYLQSLPGTQLSHAFGQAALGLLPADLRAAGSTSDRYEASTLRAYQTFRSYLRISTQRAPAAPIAQLPSPEPIHAPPRPIASPGPIAPVLPMRAPQSRFLRYGIAAGLVAAASLGGVRCVASHEARDRLAALDPQKTGQLEYTIAALEAEHERNHDPEHQRVRTEERSTASGAEALPRPCSLLPPPTGAPFPSPTAPRALNPRASSASAGAPDAAELALREARRAIADRSSVPSIPDPSARPAPAGSEPYRTAPEARTFPQPLDVPSAAAFHHAHSATPSDRRECLAPEQITEEEIRRADDPIPPPRPGAPLPAPIANRYPTSAPLLASTQSSLLQEHLPTSRSIELTETRTVPGIMGGVRYETHLVPVADWTMPNPLTDPDTLLAQRARSADTQGDANPRGIPENPKYSTAQNIGRSIPLVSALGGWIGLW